MERKRPVKGDCYRHFKGREYEVIAIAKHSETLEDMVVYEALYDDHPVFVRPLEMFMSKVDKEKYPDADQEYRFCSLDEEETKVLFEEPLILRFLELKDKQDKVEFLQTHKAQMTDSFLSIAAESLDFVESEDTLETRYHSMVHYLKTLIKYESGRLR